jgi:hypothetical protein
MIEVHTEHLLNLRQAAASLPTRPNLSTIFRWMQRGCRGIRLETILIGGTRHTSTEALQRFFEATTAAADGQPIPSRTNRRRDTDVATAEKELAKAGW